MSTERDSLALRVFCVVNALDGLLLLMVYIPSFPLFSAQSFINPYFFLKLNIEAKLYLVDKALIDYLPQLKPNYQNARKKIETNFDDCRIKESSFFIFVMITLV